MLKTLFSRPSLWPTLRDIGRGAGKRALQALILLLGAALTDASLALAPAQAQDQTQDPQAAEADEEAIPASLPNEVKSGPAASWRFLSGQGVDGALRLSPEAIERVGAPIGHFVLNVADRGFYQGVYNIREDGASIVGVFWPDGAAVEDPIAGLIDIGAAPTGEELGPTEARLTFLNGELIAGAQAQ